MTTQQFETAAALIKKIDDVKHQIWIWETAKLQRINLQMRNVSDYYPDLKYVNIDLIAFTVLATLNRSRNKNQLYRSRK